MTAVPPATGLQTSIWNNNIKSMLLLALYPIILGFVIFAAVAVYVYNTMEFLPTQSMSMSWHVAAHQSLFITQEYWPTILTVVIVWFMLAYLFQGTLIRGLSHSHGVTRMEEPGLYNLLENMCIAQGMRMPRLEVVETHARNAFASGINESTFCITVTRGLMQSLTRDELEAVLAHELTHIRNRDVRLMMVCVVFTGMLGILAQLIWSQFRYSLWVPRRSERGNGTVLFLIVLGIIVSVGYAASVFTRLALSRRREFMADAGAVQITRNPEGMMRALIRIAGADQIPQMPADVRGMCFENARPFAGIFATHPPIEKRIQAIADFSGLPVPDMRRKISAGPQDAFVPASMENRRDNWTTRQRFRHRRDANPWK